MYAPLSCKPGLRHSVNRAGCDNADIASEYEEFNGGQKPFAACLMMCLINEDFLKFGFDLPFFRIAFCLNDMHIAGVIADCETNQTHPGQWDGKDDLRRFFPFAAFLFYPDPYPLRTPR